MASVVGGGRQVQILETDGHSFELDVHALGRILCDDRVKDKPVVVVAVVGTFRKGKSFLLSFLLRYLRNSGRDGWLGDPDAPLEGFDWSGGCDGHTTGILVWDEVFLVKTSGGGEVAVLLMDTQGTFDCKTAAKVHTAIFALSTLVSSVLVYNVSQNIQEDDLEHLQLFTEYSRLAQLETNTEPFQKLLFLVRDWAYPYSASYGAEGGQVILERRLQITEFQDAGLRQLRQRLRSCFAEIDCFLMPHPGKRAATSQAFDGRPSEIDEDFIEQLLQLVALILAPDNLLVKKINGQRITCQQLMAYFEAYVHALKKNPVLGPQSAYEATIQASNLAAVYMARDLYITKMLNVWSEQRHVDRGMMEGHHKLLLVEAKDLFENTLKMGGPEYTQRYMDRLTRASSVCTQPVYRFSNLAKKISCGLTVNSASFLMVRDHGEPTVRCFLISQEIEGIFHHYSEYFDDTPSISMKRIVDSVAFKAAHAVVTTGLTGVAVGLAVVELPVIAAVCGAIGAVSLTGYVYHTVDTYRRKRKEKTDEMNRPLIESTAEGADDNLPESAQVFEPAFEVSEQLTKVSSGHQPTYSAEMPERATGAQATRQAKSNTTVSEMEPDELFDNFANERVGK
ncbi:atlastin-3-like [Amblyomma americanum]